MDNFKAQGQPEGILAVWNHFKALGVSNVDIGMSKPSGEITIRSQLDTIYITWLSTTSTYRVTLYSSASTKPERRKRAKKFSKIEDAISEAQNALGY